VDRVDRVVQAGAGFRRIAQRVVKIIGDAPQVFLVVLVERFALLAQ
jgi:hypothetical protein